MHRSLRRVLGPSVPPSDTASRRARYYTPALLFLVAAAMLIASAFLPYWRLTLHAPQYPKGLHVEAYLDRLDGDVREIDGLNHYIGMRPLAEAASFEKTFSILGIGVTALLAVAAVFVHTRWAALLALPAIAFPLLFLADLQFWLANFGQNLDPTAPLSSSIDPFVPPVLGEGAVGQFRTTSAAGPGLLLAAGASLTAVVGLALHRRAFRPLVEAMAAEGGNG